MRTMDFAANTGSSAEAVEYLAAASAARVAGDVDALRSALVDAFNAAQRTGDTETMAAAALGMPTSQRFGVHPGQIRARIAVRKAIAAAITQIDRHDPGLARLLRDSVCTGGSCRYDPNPDQRVKWVTK